ncbi:MAG: protein phosphatase 2C domain-containing protein [Dehalococcoidia bacterium]
MLITQQDRILELPAPDSSGAGTRIVWYATTHNGLVRPENEDAHVVDAQAARDTTLRHLLAVADGCGGHRAGATASRTALRTILNEFRYWNGGSPERFISSALRRANDEVFGEAHANYEFSNMQTTVTAVVLEHDILAVGHVGDCRLYRLRKGHTELLTRDHTMASELVHMHMITPEQGLDHPGRHQLTRSLGSEPLLQIDTVKEKIIPGDTYLICSDGLWSQATHNNIEDILQNNAPDKACKEFVNLALKGGAPDNVTAIVFNISSVGSQPPSRSFWRKILGHHQKDLTSS